jgi:hypothetical protein
MGERTAPRTPKGLEAKNFTPVRKGKLLTRDVTQEKAAWGGWRGDDALRGRGKKGASMEDEKTTETPKAAEPAPSSEPMELTKLGEDIGEAAPSQPMNSPELTADTQVSSAEDPSGAKQHWKFVIAAKITQQTWLIAATVFLGLVVLLIFSLMPGRNRAVQERQAERTVESATPEIVIAGCGQPVEDVTKDLFPMIKRTMSYKPSGKGAVVLEFSRTAEEHSQWVFLAMEDENGAMRYETPETQIGALPCLDSRK